MTCSAAHPCNECREKMEVDMQALQAEKLEELRRYAASLRSEKLSNIVLQVGTSRLFNNPWLLNMNLPKLVEVIRPEVELILQEQLRMRSVAEEVI